MGSVGPHYQTFDGFFSGAKDLRKVFDRRFQNPLKAHSERFVWDYWHVPGEYTHLRTPAFQYFPRALYERFHRQLVRFGREQLGCHDISPPWLSCYVEGCRQEPHRDEPHGPLAFVYSLTPWSGRKFSGGETFITKPKTLIEPRFNRLTIFNPHLEHGVRAVKGELDPRKGRLVIHGWFVNPRPFWVGPMAAPEVQAALSQIVGGRLAADLGSGFLSLRIQIKPQGRVAQIQVLQNMLLAGQERSLANFLGQIKALRFPTKGGATRLTLPLMVAR